MFSNQILILLALVSCCQIVICNEYVPVFLWGDLQRSSQKANPLHKISGEEFSEILKEELAKEPFVVTFIEESLSVEDLSKKINGEPTFPYLRTNLDSSLYLPSVASALEQVNNLADPDKVDRVKLTENGLSAQLEPQPGKFLFISLQDAKEGESRIDMLMRHDDFMRDMYEKLRVQKNQVVAIYVARHPSWTVPEDEPSFRQKRETAAKVTESADAQTYNQSSLLFYINNITLQQDGGTVEILKNGQVTETKTDTEINVTMAFANHTIELQFTEQSGYWFLNSVVLNSPTIGEAITLNGSNIYALKNFSYHCSDEVMYVGGGNNDSYTLTFADFQIQPFYDTAPLQFGDAFDCVNFTSAPIWSGLFVVAIMLLITFYGITMMMDIRTMDRFDDPKGKTITINATD